MRQSPLGEQSGERLLVGDDQLAVEGDHLSLHPQRPNLGLVVVQDVAADRLDPVRVEQ